jgi:hypothetical protein
MDGLQLDEPVEVATCAGPDSALLGFILDAHPASACLISWLLRMRRGQLQWPGPRSGESLMLSI